ncbi:hypothetical protein B0H13DRAFT_2365242 [Mycena leptocephala]|nr:hypothetical protein B0H13DRAFT_2365242 [Mycena leptocephala]
MLRRTLALIDKLVAWTIETGMLTSAMTVTSLICYFAKKDSFIWVAVSTVEARMFSNSLLASLNSRATLRAMNEVSLPSLHFTAAMASLSNGVQITEVAQMASNVGLSRFQSATEMENKATPPSLSSAPMRLSDPEDSPGANASPPSRITQRTMTIQELSAWVSSAHANVQEIAITDILWWAKRSVLRHQFLVLRFDYAGATYELTIERVGKLLLSPSQTAVDQAEFRVAPAGRDAEFEKKNKLLFGLLTDEKLLPNGYVSHPAFVDFVDHKWCGPRAKLSDIARYAALVRSQEIRYSITRANCYFFARVLFHTIALRHYSLPLLTSSDPLWYFALTTGRDNRSPKLSLNAGVVWESNKSFNRFDPSSTGIVFRFLLRQGDSNSATFWTRFIFIFTIPMILGAAGGAIAEAELPFVQRRGDYTPILIPTTAKTWSEAKVIRKMRTEYTPVNETREMPTLWEHEEQVYPEGREEYRAAWELLHTSADVDNGSVPVLTLLTGSHSKQTEISDIPETQCRESEIPETQCRDTQCRLIVVRF